MKRINPAALKRLPAVVGALLFAALLVRFPREAAEGVRDGLRLCAVTVIPSLFPFMALCSFLVKSGACEAMGRFASPVTKALFKLPGCVAGAVVMGLCGGYPVGMSMTAQLLKSGRISRNDAFRMTLFCVNAGPAFVIGAVGSSMLGSHRAGLALFLSLCASSLTVGFLTRFTNPQNGETNADFGQTEAFYPQERYQSLQKSLVEAVAETAAAMLSVCAWIVLFACLCAALTLLPRSLSQAALPLKCVLEVTSGCAEAVVGGVPLPVLAMVIGFGGFSVHFQVLQYTREAGVPFSVFLASRVVGGALAAVACVYVLRLFPVDVTAFLNNVEPIASAHSYSAPVSAGILIMSALLIIDTVPAVETVYRRKR
ncbi:MAG: hypothetical protein FWF05_01115 [Oscillospiraceae bacterium]|nr:hypothetical protein [Oscillospiraceae bacterium]